MASALPAVTTPISPELFALAIYDLPLDALFGKVGEIENSISHLQSSNAQLVPFAEEGDNVCREAIAENNAVLARQLERIQLCRSEVERRGMPWLHQQEPEHATSSTTAQSSATTNGHTDGDGARRQETTSGTLSDEELRGRLEAQLAADEDQGDEDAGVHL